MLCSYNEKTSQRSKNGSAHFPDLELLEYTFLQPLCVEEVTEPGNTSSDVDNASDNMKEAIGVLSGRQDFSGCEQEKDPQLWNGSFIIDENNNMIFQNCGDDLAPNADKCFRRRTKSVCELTSDFIDVHYFKLSSKSEVFISSNSKFLEEKDDEITPQIFRKSTAIQEKLAIKFEKYNRYSDELDLDSASICKSRVVFPEEMDIKSQKFEDELKKLPVKSKSEIISEYLDQLQKPKEDKDFASLLKEPALLPLELQLTEFVKVRKPRYQVGDVVILKEDPFFDYLIKVVTSWKKCCYHVQQVTGPGDVFKWVADEEVMKKKRRVAGKGPGIIEIYVNDASVQANILVKEHFELLDFIRSRDVENEEGEHPRGEFNDNYEGEHYVDLSQTSNNGLLSKKARPVRVPLISDVIKLAKSCQTEENVQPWKYVFNGDSAPSSLCSSLDNVLRVHRNVPVEKF